MLPRSEVGRIRPLAEIHLLFRKRGVYLRFAAPSLVTFHCVWCLLTGWAGE
jgi:hypothetical protein